MHQFISLRTRYSRFFLCGTSAAGGAEVLLYVRFAVARRAEALLTVRTHERLGAGVQSHVHLQTALG